MPLAHESLTHQPFLTADALLVAAGADPFQLVDEAVVAAAALSGGARALRDKQIPVSADAFGWCTWDAFYSDVSAKGKLPSQRAGSILPVLAPVLQRHWRSASGGLPVWGPQLR